MILLVRALLVAACLVFMGSAARPASGQVHMNTETAMARHPTDRDVRRPNSPAVDYTCAENLEASLIRYRALPSSSRCDLFNCGSYPECLQQCQSIAETVLEFCFGFCGAAETVAETACITGSAYGVTACDIVDYGYELALDMAGGTYCFGPFNTPSCLYYCCDFLDGHCRCVAGDPGPEQARSADDSSTSINSVIAGSEVGVR